MASGQSERSPIPMGTRADAASHWPTTFSTGYSILTDQDLTWEMLASPLAYGSIYPQDENSWGFLASSYDGAGCHGSASQMLKQAAIEHTSESFGATALTYPTVEHPISISANFHSTDVDTPNNVQAIVTSPSTDARLNAKHSQKLQCPEPGCNRTYTRSHKLSLHLLSFHDGMKNHACELPGCCKRFSTKSDCARHMSTHDVLSKMYHVCDDCDRTFSRRDAVLEHKRRHCKHISSTMAKFNPR